VNELKKFRGNLRVWERILVGNGERESGEFRVSERESAELEWGRRKKKKEIRLLADF